MHERRPDAQMSRELTARAAALCGALFVITL